MTKLNDVKLKSNITIITPGTDSRNDVYRGTCTKCGCDFKTTKSQCTEYFNLLALDRPAYEYYHKCPMSFCDQFTRMKFVEGVMC
jgi:hypothetical protein